MVLVEGTLDKTWTSNVFVVTLDIDIQELETGSPALGYVWFVALLSSAQVKVKESFAILTLSPLINPWSLTVNVTIPVVGLYAASVAVYDEYPRKLWSPMIKSISPVVGV